MTNQKGTAGAQPALLTIEQMWECTYSADVLRNCGELQTRELRKAFYAGAYHVLCQLYKAGDEEKDYSVVDWLQETMDDCAGYLEAAPGVHTRGKPS